MGGHKTASAEARVARFGKIGMLFLLAFSAAASAQEAQDRKPQLMRPPAGVKSLAIPPKKLEGGEGKVQPLNVPIGPAPVAPQVAPGKAPTLAPVKPAEQPSPNPPPPERKLKGEGTPQVAAPGADEGTMNISEKRCRPLPPNVKIMVNFNEAEMQEIVQWISKQTCKNFIIGDGVRGGKITILSNTPVTAEEAYRAFLAALNVNNMTVVKVGDFYKIQMKRDAPKDTIPTYIGEEVEVPTLDQMVTRLVQLKYMDANTVSGTIKQLITKDGDCYPFAPTNTLIISDTGNNMYRLMEILKQLDTPLGQDEIRVVQVEYAAAAELAKTLEAVFGDKAAAGQPGRKAPAVIKPATPAPPPPQGQATEEGTETVSLTKVIADERTNKLILVAPARAFDRIMVLLKQLDVPIPGEGQIQVVYLKYAAAEELATTLTSLAQGLGPKSQGRPAGAPGQPGARTAELFQGEVKVTADKATNSLVIIASATDFRNILKVIQQLDLPRRQVFVEAVIMEVNLDTSRDTGLAFHAGAGAKIAGETVPLFFGTQFKAQGSNFNSLAPNISLLGFLSGLRGPQLAGEDSILAGISLPSFGVMLQALQTDSNVNVLSTPTLLTSDNEQAEIKVGENIPIPAGYGGYGGGMSSLAGLASLASSASGTTTTTGTSGYGAYGGYGGLYGGLLGLGMGAINRQEVGLTLKIKPQINEGKIIRMELEEELSEVKDTSNPLGPTTTKRSAKTVVEVLDQQTVVVGGLIRDKIDIGETKVPVLGDIPVLGWFFRNRREQKTKTNLLLFLTPYVIDGPRDFQTIFERKMRERREFIERFYGRGPEYRSFVDFNKKHGPLAGMHLVLKQELSKFENGGPGAAGQKLIAPEAPPSAPALQPEQPSALESRPQPAQGSEPLLEKPAEPPARLQVE
jgi:general secretion pathway protein D